MQSLLDPLTLVCLIFSGTIVLCGLGVAVIYPKLFLLMFKNLRRNALRTALTTVATMVLVAMVTVIWTIVFFIDKTTAEKAEDVKLIVTEKWQLPSQLPMTHADMLNPKHSNFLPSLRGKYGEKDFMTWSFYGGTLDPKKMTRDNTVFFFCMEPEHIKPMMDDLQDLDEKLVDKLKANRQGALLGVDRLKTIKKEVGDTIKLTSFNYKGIDLELTIVGILPEGRWSSGGIMNVEYFYKALDDYKHQNKKAHEMDSKRLNLIWLRVRDQKTFSEVAEIIENDPALKDRPVKCETAAAGIASFLDAFRDIFWGVKWLLVPAMLTIMVLVISISISITVRERFTEMAVLKVLGFRPGQVQILVLGEALLIGGMAGFLAGGLTWLIVNQVYGGIYFPIAFFPMFVVPWEAVLWGATMGLSTGLLGSFLPSLSARSVKVSEVFSRVG